MYAVPQIVVHAPHFFWISRIFFFLVLSWVGLGCRRKEKRFVKTSSERRFWNCQKTVQKSILEGSWGVLGGILGGLGGLLGRLGGVLGGLRPAWVHFCRFKLNKVRSCAQLAPKKRPNMAPKMGAKTDQNRRQKRRRKKTLFKIVLKRSWSHLGPILGHFDLQNRALA